DYFFSTSTQAALTSNSYVAAFSTVGASSGIAASDSSTIVLPAGVYLVDITFSSVSYTAAGMISCGAEYGGSGIVGSIYSYSASYTGHADGAGHLCFPLVSDGVKTLKLKCLNISGGGAPIIRTSIVEL
ncbi:MAG TPA: hypothetical protein PKW30_02125, partial [Campylobacterales bacterium]|nr:hypothetical protein [Campylobacterales bacterium]